MNKEKLNEIICGVMYALSAWLIAGGIFVLAEGSIITGASMIIIGIIIIAVISYGFENDFRC